MARLRLFLYFFLNKNFVFFTGKGVFEDAKHKSARNYWLQLDPSEMKPKTLEKCSKIGRNCNVQKNRLQNELNTSNSIIAEITKL